MYHILEALVRWLAPVCCFTAEDKWAEMPGERQNTVMLATWYQGLQGTDEASRTTMQRLRKVREVVGPWLEKLRRDKTIGAALAPGMTLQAGGRPPGDLER